MKYLKTYTLYERVSKETQIFEDFFSQYEERKVCDSIIADIKDIVLELSDIGLFTTVGYTPMTLTYKEKTPKMMVEIQGELDLCDSNEDEIDSTFERIKDYVKSLGYVTGFGSWERELNTQTGGRKIYKVYQMLIQK